MAQSRVRKTYLVGGRVVAAGDVLLALLVDQVVELGNLDNANYRT